jgi:hypothetical protein
MSELQTFNSKDARHTFVVDGGTYYLPAFSISDIKPIAELAKLDPEGQADGMRGIIAERVQCERGPVLRFLTGWKDPRAAVAALGITQSSELFKAWAAAAKVTPGESSSSAD